MTSIANAAPLAGALAASYRKVDAAPRPVDRKQALAHFQGMCDATHAFGFGMTPHAVWMVVADAVQAAGPYPGMTADNTPRKRWTAQTTRAIVAGLGAL